MKIFRFKKKSDHITNLKNYKWCGRIGSFNFYNKENDIIVSFFAIEPSFSLEVPIVHLRRLPENCKHNYTKLMKFINKICKKNNKIYKKYNIK
jgi:hypothetical protein